MLLIKTDENKQNYEILITSNSYQHRRVFLKYWVWVTLDLWVFLYGNVTSHHVCPLQITNIEEEMWEVQLREIVGIEKCCILISFPSLLNTPTYFTTSSSFSLYYNVIRKEPCQINCVLVLSLSVINNNLPTFQG